MRNISKGVDEEKRRGSLKEEHSVRLIRAVESNVWSAGEHAPIGLAPSLWAAGFSKPAENPEHFYYSQRYSTPSFLAAYDLL